MLATQPLNGQLPATITQLTALTRLNVDNCGLTGVLPAELATMQAMQVSARGRGIVKGEIKGGRVTGGGD